MIQFLLLASILSGGQKIKPELEKDLHIWVSRDVAPSSKIRININTRNIPVVHVNCLPMDGLKWLGRPHTWDKRPSPIGPVSSHFDLTIARPDQVVHQHDNFYSRQVNLPSMKSGVYLLNVAAGGKEAWAVVNVTNLNVVAKRSPYHTLVWVTRFKSGATVSDATLSFFDERGERHYAGKTGADGAAVLEMPPTQQSLVVQEKGDMAGLQTSAQNPDGILRCLFQTDRPIYRPGQTISYKAVLRLTHGQAYDAVRNSEVSVQLRDPRDNPLDQITLVSNDIGSIAGAFKVPQEGMLGAYTVVLSYKHQSAYQTFTVAEYRKPEYKVDVKPVQKRYLSGEDIHFAVDTAYYFGAPVPQAQVQWIVRRNNSPYRWISPEDRWFYGGDGNLYPRDTYASSPYAADGVGVTDNHGHLDVSFHSDKDAPDSTYSITLTVIDSSRRQVTGSSSVPVYASLLRVGIMCLRQTVTIGDLVPVQVRLVDLDGHPQPGKVRLEVVTQVWIEKEGIYKPKVLATKVVAVPTTGNADVNLPALDYGSLSIEAETTDSTGRKARASDSVWVASLDYKPAKEIVQPSMELRLDKHAYLPGQKIRAYATTNRPTRPILLVMSGGDIWDYKVVQPKGAIAMWVFDAITKQSPNAYITADQWAENGLMASNAVVPLPDRSRLLTVQITPDKPEYKPGDKATYEVRTVDQDGHGVSAEIAIAVVDEAIYALSQDITPDPYGFYWGLRGDEVLSFQSAPEELSGGAFQNVSSVAPVRQRFEDTAFWNAFVKTDTEGRGEVSFEMPGNLTSWRATARAITGDTRVGSVTSNVTATRPVTLRLATPRIASQGDYVTMIATINNRSDKPLKFDANLRGEGVTVDSPTKQQVDVAAKSEGTVRWNLAIKDVPSSGFMKLTARVGAIGSTDPDYGDALSVSVPIVPRGVQETTLLGGSAARQAFASLILRENTLAQGSLLSVKISGGVQAITRETADRLIANGRYGTMWAVNALKAAVAIDAPKKSDDLREAFALLSRDQQGDGWGWWEGVRSDPKITAEVGYALAMAEKHGYTVFPSIKNAAIGACVSQYQQTNLWEDRARLAASLRLLMGDQAPPYLAEVIERGLNLSPFAKLRMAEVLSSYEMKSANPLIDNVLTLVSNGPTTAYVPLGFGIGWSASESETTAELLTVLHLAHRDKELQVKLARRLAIPENDQYQSPEDLAATVVAMSLYSKDHPDARSIGEASITVNGKQYPMSHSTVDESASVEIRDSILHGGLNTIELDRKGDGEAFFTVQARTYRPTLAESIRGVRVTRRFEVKNEAGVWTEVNGVVKPGEPVRCTVVVWGDDISDALRVNEPIPAGFEYVDSDYTRNARQEVRDGRLVHYLLNSGTPTYFRYYIRAEADGKLIALPATAEYLRRPATRGNSSATEIVVHP